MNDLELIFVVRSCHLLVLSCARSRITQVAYQRILQLTYVDDLLFGLKKLFIQYFGPFLTSFVASLHASSSGQPTRDSAMSWDFSKAFEGWDAAFDQLLKGLEQKAAQVRTLIFACS